MSLGKLEQHRRIWEGKPVLRAVYAEWFDRLLRVLPPGVRVFEVGAGPGFLAAHARRSRPDLRWVASDLVRTPWNDLVADALRLPLASGSVDAVVGIDVLHHLERPDDFFEEARRVLAPGGAVTLVEPWVSPLSAIIYRFWHEERFRLRVDPVHPYRAGKDPFDGDNALAWAVSRQPAPKWRALGFEPPAIRRLNTLPYILSLGFRPRSLLPERAIRPLVRLDEQLAALSPLLALRAHVTWRRAAD